MNDALLQFCRAKGSGRYDEIVAAFKRREELALRRALIQNGAHPDFLNGHPKDQEKGRLAVSKRKKKGGRRGY